jgi:putative ABC transport system permease protein
LSVLDRKLRREMRKSWGILLAITSIVAVGVACYVEMSSCYTNLVEAQEAFYDQCRMADFSVELKKAPLAELQTLRALPEVVEIRPRIQFYATVDLERVTELLNAQVLSLPDDQRPVINDILLRRGSYFTGARRNEVIVNDAFARRHALRPGQSIHLILNNRRQELFIVGTAISSEFVYLVGPGSIVPDPEHFGVFYLKQTFAEEVFDFDGAANQVVGILTPAARRHPEDLLRRAELLLSSYGVFSTTPRKDQASNRYLSEELKGLATFTFFMPAIFLSVAALVLNVLLTRLTEQQRTTVGTLKAIGYSDWQVFGHFLKFGLAIGLAGGLVGCALGYVLAAWVTGIYGQFYEFPELANRFYWGKSAIGLGISLGCAVVGTLHGARAVLRLMPAEAMRPKPPVQYGKTFLEHLGRFWQRLGFGWRMVLRDLVRNRVRTVVGIFAAAMGTSILVTGFMMQEAMTYLLDFQFNRVQRSDLDLTFKDERGRDALSEVRRLPGVDYAEPVLDVACTFRHGPYSRRGAVTGLARGAVLTIPRDQQGRAVRIPAAGVVISRKLAEVLHVGVGDELTVRPIQGRREERQVPVVEVIDSYLGMTVYTEIDYLNRIINEEFAITGAQLAIDPRPAQHDSLHRELKQLPAVQAVYARADFVHNLQETVIKTQSIFIGMLIFFAGVIFFNSILNASLVSLSERQREVATLRVLGYGPWQVGGLFLRESMVVNLLGTLLGMPVGYWLCSLLAEAYENEMLRIPVVTSPAVWTWTLALAILFGLLAHGLVQREIHRMDWLDALKVKE